MFCANKTFAPSLSWRLGLSAFVISFFTLLAVSAVMFHSYNRMMKKEYFSQLDGYMGELVMLLREVKEHPQLKNGEIMSRWVHSELTNEHYAALLADADGVVLDKSEGFSFSYDRFMHLAPKDTNKLFWTENGVRFLLGRRTMTGADGAEGYVLVARDMEEELGRQGKLLSVLLWLSGLTSLVIGFLSFIFARVTLRPLSLLSAHIKGIGAKDLHKKLAAREWPAELRPLVHAFDGMLDRLEENFTRLNRFSSDLAHELRTPLHQLRMAVEVTLSKPRANEEYADSLASVLENVADLNRLVEELLFIARAENGKTVVKKQEVSAEELAEKLKDFFQDGFDEHSVRLDARGARGTLWADRAMLVRAAVNIVSNALRYMPDGGNIRLETSDKEGARVLSFFNDGSAIAGKDIAHIFDRFYKADSARNARDSYGGSGLGLSIVSSIMKLHGGHAEAENLPGGEGVVFRLVFPRKG